VAFLVWESARPFFHSSPGRHDGGFCIPLVALFGIHLWELVFYEMLMGVVVNFHHANIGLPEPVDRLLRAILVTPVRQQDASHDR